MIKKTHILIFMAVGILAVIGFSQTMSKSVWGGRIEAKDGIQVLKNPGNPLFGVRPLDLAEDLTLGNDNDKNVSFYRVRAVKTDRDGDILVLDSGNFRIQVLDRSGRFIRTIGRQGQGPGEFQMPVALELNDATGHIFVYDVATQSLAVFDKNGAFQRAVRIPGCHVFAPLEDDGVLAVILKAKDADLLAQHALCRLGPNGTGENMLASVPYNLFMEHFGTETLSVTTGHELSLCLARVDDRSFVYGYSKNYVLTLIDDKGRIIGRFENEEPKPAFTVEELKAFRRIPVPQQKPYFYALLADSMGRIYVRRVSVEGIRGRGPVDLRPVDVEVFSKDGYYLFKTTLPPNTGQIKDGMIYSYTVNEETGEERVKRLRIKNWAELPVGPGDKQIP